jgi:hypothetical protein
VWTIQRISVQSLLDHRWEDPLAWPLLGFCPHTWRLGGTNQHCSPHKASVYCCSMSVVQHLFSCPLFVGYGIAGNPVTNRILVLSALAVLPLPVSAWNIPSHMLSAAIAYQGLRQENPESTYSLRHKPDRMLYADLVITCQETSNRDFYRTL